MATGKQVNDYTRSQSTTEYLDALSSDTGFPVSALVQALSVNMGIPILDLIQALSSDTGIPRSALVQVFKSENRPIDNSLFLIPNNS